MAFDSIFWVALQSSVILGLVHGVNPCGHSWLVLAPFVYGEKNGNRVFTLTSAFILGTSLACLAIGLTLGSISLAIPASFSYYVDIFTFVILLTLGIILIVKPSLLHNHDHDHCHDHTHEHAHGHDHKTPSARNITAWGLFSIGFVNMIVPCPTVAIMYTYALDSGSLFKGTMVFGAYAVGTAIALGAVIYAIYKAAGFVRTLEQDWVEPMVMRTAGVMTIAFGAYSLYTSTL
ncbi:sulfite exporter TauE/SafE family protein [uncultured Pseudodesulfovibrio sp.]|uniref:urease accessory protein UreH domain-containing protein n=1 Tax=uncultured Pseudodesulfovibrio sp. TaxID=2035858 RepID=UPI0029C93AA6|nr:sulfite exporter TauE/SafE family protein [uncultured Pseudodesulfovibrio sp.]